MSTTTQSGYNELDYNVGDYNAGVIYFGKSSQSSRKIVDRPKSFKSQVQRIISEEHSIHAQSQGWINHTDAIQMQVNRINSEIHEVKMQSERITSARKITHTQVTSTIDGVKIFGSQVNRYLEDVNHAVNMEVNRLLTGQDEGLHMEIKRGVNTHRVGDVYNVGGYNETPYNAPRYDVLMRSTVERILGRRYSIHAQVERAIFALHSINEQSERRIDRVKALRAQVDRIQARTLHMQVIQALYNTTNLRILIDFASRGVSGTNWNSNSTSPGDFSVNNVNTDIDEQVWRSTNGTLSGIILTCDTQVNQGVFVDTINLRNHNMTTSASVVVQGSSAPDFSSVGFTQTLQVKKDNVYWISETLPITSYRYWRFLISDPTNTNPYIQIGTILFGSSLIMAGECFVENVIKTRKHFSDKVRTEGFTNVSNNRAMKYSVSLDFRSLDFQKANYTMLSNVFDTARTSLKCLWIPTPQYPERFAVFGKLASLPSENHNSKGEKSDYISFGIEVDESL